MILAFNYLDTTTFTWKENYTPNNLDYTDTMRHGNDSQKSSSSKAGVIAGPIIGVISFFSLIGGLFWFYRRRKRNSFYAAPYSSTEEQTSSQDKTKKFSVSSGSTAVEELPRLSMSSGLAVPMAGTSENGTHGKDYTTLLEERMMDSDIQQTNFMIVPKSPLRVTNPDNN
jgi:LPXTG-motif cell wall-anchored protein